MNNIRQAEQKIIDEFLPVILKNEAKGLLQDLLGAPSLAMHFMFFDHAQTVKAVDHISGIFKECYQAGHLKIAISQEDGRLYGYAIIFEHPDSKISRYCHKIFVFEEFRGNGIGTQILQLLMTDSRGFCLLCRHDLIPFYEAVGLEMHGVFTPPEARQGFAMTRGMYTGLVLMYSPNASPPAPVFMLNDQDISQIIALCAD